MTLDWHQRFLQQAEWTRETRDYLFGELSLSPESKVLEIGSGTGVIAADFRAKYLINVITLDKQFSRLAVATRNYGNLFNIAADAYYLPFKSGQFDLIFCHYFLLWLSSPLKVLEEVFRALKPGGTFLALAEPDHDARIDAPPALEKLGHLQTASLIAQGANPAIGRQLPALAGAAGFIFRKYGAMGFEQVANALPDWWKSEWQVLREDLAETFSREQLDKLQEEDRFAWITGSRVLWVPTFFLSCFKPINPEK